MPKILNKHFKLKPTARTAYLYADGHAVVIHEDRHDEAGPVSWVEIVESLDLHCSFEGRIIFSRIDYDARFALLLSNKVDSVYCQSASADYGSDATKRLGLEIGKLSFSGKGLGLPRSELHWYLLSAVLSDGITYQPEVCESFEVYRDNNKWDWSGHHIGAIYRKPQPQVKEVVCA